MKIFGKAIEILTSVLVGFVAGCGFMLYVLGPAIAEHRMLGEKHLAIMSAFKAWMISLENGRTVEEYFIQNGYKTAAVYGMGFLGERLLAQLQNSSIDVRYLIDQQLGSVYGDIPVCSPQEELGAVDVIIVTPVYYFYEIRKKLQTVTDAKIISIEDIFK